MHDAIELSCFTIGPFAQNCYLLVGPSGRRAAIVDPGIGSEPLLETVRERGLELEWIVNTHGHLDHAAGNHYFKKETRAPLVIHPDDELFLTRLEEQGAMFGLEVPNSPPPDQLFAEGKPWVFDGASFDVIHTPGHTPGGVCLRFGGRMLVGDTLFNGSIGRTDLPGGAHGDLIASIRNKLFALPEEIVCYSGHGPETTLGAERRTNPFVSDRALGAGLAEGS